MKKLWFGIGAAVIVVLLLLQTRFTTYATMESNGFAVEEDTIQEMLLTDKDAVAEVDSVTLYAYDSLSALFKRGNSYYLGEEKKTEIDMAFPFIINGGAGIQLMTDEGALFDCQYEEVKTYEGLRIVAGIAYNPDGTRADATEYLFYELPNGLFMNFQEISYMDRGATRTISPGSFIYFDRTYFTYCEIADGVATYQICRSMKDDYNITIDGDKKTYYRLLVDLGIIPERSNIHRDPNGEDQELEIGEEGTGIDDELLEGGAEGTDEEGNISDQDTEADASLEDEEDTKVKPPKRPNKPNAGGTASKPGGSKPVEGTMGVRPDYMRPDRPSRVPQPEVQDYVKPTVSIGSVETGVYRIMVDVQVTDPANRLSQLRKVQLEFYEQLSGDKERLAYRGYTGSSKVIEAGSGIIKPGTTYRINAYFTYFDEFNQAVVEAIPLENSYVTTGDVDEIGPVVLKTGTEGLIDYCSIPVYYDNNLQICNVTFDAESSDSEAIYGIGRTQGITLEIQGVTNPFFSAKKIIDSQITSEFKNGTLVNFQSNYDLSSNSNYSYRITMKDYFGNTIEVVNNEGDFVTCKARPQGSLKIETNKVGEVVLRANVMDGTEAAVPAENSQNYDFYLVISSQEDTDKNPLLWDDCQAYIDNGYSRVPGDEAAGTEEGRVHFLYRFKDNPCEYKDGDQIKIDMTVMADCLDLDTKYYAYLYCDFDLNNQAGVQRFGQIGALSFRSASLASLGKIYIKADITDITANSARITYSLNESKSSQKLMALMDSVQFDICATNGAEPGIHASMLFDSTSFDYFAGRTTDENDNPVYGSVLMDKSYFDGTNGGPLMSMTDYEIQPVIGLLYNGKHYEVDAVLNQSMFKTLRKTATVQVENVVLAAGTLRFDARVNDPDDAITGNSGHAVVVNIYDYSRNFITAIRIDKNTEGLVHQEITGLDSDKKFFMNFLAQEYNEGYTNATFESNKIIYTHYIEDSVDLSGSVKLQQLADGARGGEYLADIEVRIQDPDKIMEGQLPYYLSVTKDGVDITALYDNTVTEVWDYTYGTGDDWSTLEKAQTFRVEEGGHTYEFTLYVVLAGNKLILDTLHFTTEDEIIGIPNAQALLDIKNIPGGDTKRYCVTGDLDFNDPTNSGVLLEEPIQPTKIFELFNGQIDFQGFPLRMNRTNKGAALFTNLGTNGELFNLNLEINMDSPSYMSWTGVICYFNFGHIHDVFIDYRGGSDVSNQYFGLVASINASSGIIENFVAHNNPQDGLLPFAGNYDCGMISGRNYGIIRNGYVYGADVRADVGTPRSGDLRVAGITGYQTAPGILEHVYSLVNVVVYPPGEGGVTAPTTSYGAIAGYDSGTTRYAYSIGRSTYAELHQGLDYNSNGIGPAVGYNCSRTEQVYYWNEEEIEYTAAKYQDMINRITLYDYDWQGQLLGQAFNTQPVEVGYYPHVKLSQELPAQPYIALPARTNGLTIEIMSSSVLSYAEDGSSAVVEFRISNPRNAVLEEVVVDGLKVELYQETAVSQDGYTTIQALVSEPEKYVSQYEIAKVKYSIAGRQQIINFSPKPFLAVEFYRFIYTVDDWFEYVVKKPSENAKLAADLDFAGVSHDRMTVYKYGKDFTGKLDSLLKEGQTYGYSLKNIGFDTSRGYIFHTLNGSVSNICIENYTVDCNAKNGSLSSFIAYNYGTVDNVHMKNVNITGYGYVSSLVAVSYAGSTVSNCSASDVNINYLEPENTNTEGRIGGLIGQATSSRISNCYVRNVDIQARDIGTCIGAGGLLGQNSSSVIDSVYATGDVYVYGQNVGGIIGAHSGHKEVNALTNLIARVNVTTSQDRVGGMVGTVSVNSTLTERNNMSGVAFGNIYCTNPDAENCSYTIGSMDLSRVVFFGSEIQLINGVAGNPKDENTHALLSYEGAMNPARYTDEQLVNMGNTYDYSPVKEGCLPILYYENSTTPLPFQEAKEYIWLQNSIQHEVEVVNIGVNESGHYIWMDLEGPANHRITGLVIEDLECEPLGNFSFDAQGDCRLVVYYKDVYQQHRYKDSYAITSLSYESPTGVARTEDFSAFPVRVPLTLYAEIYDIPTWNAFINKDNNYGNYDNYMITRDIDFSSGAVYTTNAKLGRLVGQSSGEAIKLSGIHIKRNNENFILRLNSELANLHFVDCFVNTAGRNIVGLIGTSAASIHDVNFENISIENKSTARTYMGVIAYQQGGRIGIYDEQHPELGKVVLKNIKVGTNGIKNVQVGGLSGYVTGFAQLDNIEVEQITVKGNGYVGGLVGNGGNASYDHITMKDIQVTSYGNRYVGGLVGCMSCTYNSNSKAGIHNVKISGTPVYDDEGNVVDSTTVIAFDKKNLLTGSNNTNSSHIGGITGYTTVYENGFYYDPKSKEYENAPIAIDGIVVKGYTNYIGGAYGYSYRTDNVTVSNSLITEADQVTVASQRVGGISGYQYYDARRLECKNTRVVISNHSRVGLIAGEKVGGGSTQYCTAEDSQLIARNTLGAILNYFGGINGYQTLAMNYCNTYNCLIDASDRNMLYTGGLAGYTSSTVAQSFVYGSPISESSPVAQPAYGVKGYRFVGGLVGYQDAGTTGQCYANVQVEAAEDYAGGLVGLYRNNYTVRNVDGTEVFSKSGVYLRRSYFAGSVSARDYAGGAIGALGMAYNSAVSPEHKALGGRDKTAITATRVDRTIQLSSGSNYETEYTYHNMLLTDSITTDTANNYNHAYAFCGNLDGFEGKANRYNAGVKDLSARSNAAYISFWEGTSINGTKLKDMTLDSSVPQMAYNMYNTSGKRFVHLDDNAYGFLDDTYRTRWNVRLLTSDDLTKVNTYHTLLWRANNYSADGIRGDYYLTLTADIGADKYPAEYASYQGKSYLPHVRINTGTGVAVDALTRYQAQKEIRLPLPVVATGFGRLRAMNVGTASNYGMVYATGVNTVNVEFGSDLVDNGYYNLYYGDTLLEQGLITERVMTYTYDYAADIRLEYGYADLDAYRDAKEQSGLVLAQDFDLEDVLTDDTRAAYLWSLTGDPVKYSVEDLSRHVMTYENRYYYITEEGILSGTGSSATEKALPQAVTEGWSRATDLQNGGDTTAVFHAGEYVTLYNGRALQTDGQVVDMETLEVLGRISTGMARYEQTIPLQQFSLNGGLLTTYGRCTYIENEPMIIREVQILKSSNNSWAIIDGQLANDKSGAVLYTKDGKEYCTVLGEDGILIDLYQGEDVNAPKDLRTSGILAISNNQNSNAPFLLLQYVNGGVAGYNYMTGEVLFDHSISNVMDLTDYLSVYLEGEDSVLKNVAGSYASNARVAQSAGTPERLNAMISGNSSGTIISGNSTGQGADNAGAAGGEAAYGTVVVAGSDAAYGTSTQGGSSTIVGTNPVDGAQDVNGDVANSDGDSAFDSKDATSEDKDTMDDTSGESKDKDETETADSTKGDAKEPSEEKDTGAASGEPEKKSEESAAEEQQEPEAMTGTNLAELSGYKPELQEPVAVVTANQLFTVYNQTTGSYEIVDVQQFLSAPAYVSENSRLAIQNLGSYAGYAEKEKQQTTNGLGLYILVSMALVGGLAVIVVWRRKQKKA